jgi:2,5-diketo-D-gluconate reductase A
VNDGQVPAAVTHTGLAIPLLGFGTARIPATEVEQPVRVAIETGYRLIDTAAAYGNEEGIGRAIRGSGVPRDELLVTTKLRRADQGYSAALKAFDQSRKRLGLDVIDLYLIHWPLPRRDLYIETWKALARIYDRGLARAIGVSNFTIPHLTRLSRETGVIPAVNQVELHPGFQQLELRRYHEDNAILTEAWSPLGGGSALLDTAVVKRLATQCNRSAAQIILRWHIQLGNIAIPKAMPPDHIRANIDIFGFRLSEADMESLTNAGPEARVGPDPDTFDPPWEPG